MKLVQGIILMKFTRNMDFSIKKMTSKFVYAFLYDYSKSRALNIFLTFFGIIGFLWTLVECFSWLFDNLNYPEELRKYIREHLKVGLSIIAIVSVYKHRRKSKIQKTFTNTDLTVIIEFCDIFKQEGAIIIPVCDTFDNDIPSGLVNSKTLHGQFIEKYYPGNVPALNAEIVRSLANISSTPIENNTNLKGNSNRFEIGTTCPIKTTNEYFYLSALTYMKDTGNVEMQPQNIYDFLSNVWNFIPNHGEYHDVVNIPVIGTGLNRLPANYTNQFIVQEIVNSFFVTSKVQTFCKTLRICLHQKNYKFYNFDDINILFCHIDNYLNR
jgi:hypothetical protein